MKKITVKNIVEFRNKTDKSRKTFLSNIINKVPDPLAEGGGDYWIQSLSAMSNAVKNKNTEPIKEKIADILTKFQPGIAKQTRDMYQRNIDILHSYEDTDIGSWLPNNAVILNKSNRKGIIDMNNIPVQISPSQVYIFEKDDKKQVGAVWFVAQLTGFREVDLGVYAECLYTYLLKNFEEKYQISPEHCLIVELCKREEVNYQMILDEEIPSLLSSTLQDIEKVSKTL